jgi:hypothetical protein
MMSVQAPSAFTPKFKSGCGTRLFKLYIQFTDLRKNEITKITCEFMYNL